MQANKQWLHHVLEALRNAIKWHSKSSNARKIFYGIYVKGFLLVCSIHRMVRTGTKSFGASVQFIICVWWKTNSSYIELWVLTNKPYEKLSLDLEDEFVSDSTVEFEKRTFFLSIYSHFNGLIHDEFHRMLLAPCSKWFSTMKLNIAWCCKQKAKNTHGEREKTDHQ